MSITLEQLTTFLGWCTVINSVTLAVFTLAMIMGSQFIPRVHSKLLNLPETAIKAEYFKFLAMYKLIITAFNLVPYIALKIMLTGMG